MIERLDRRSRVVVAGTIGLVTFGLLWELAVRAFDIRPFVLLAPSEIGRTFVDDPTTYLDGAWVTARNALVGLAISLTASLVVGAVLAVSRFLEEAVQPILMLILVTPWVAYLPSLVIGFGAGWPPAIFLVSFVTLPAFTFGMVSGLRSADPAARELLALVNASRWEVLWRLRLPAALPTVLSSARFNAGLALAAAYFADAGNLSGDGLGAIGRAAQAVSNGPVVWTAIATTAALGVAFIAIITVIEQVALRWHVSQR